MGDYAGTALAVAKGPRGERRPVDVVGCAAHVACIATGEVDDTRLRQPVKRKDALAGAKVRTDKLIVEERSRVAAKAARSRWS